MKFPKVDYLALDYYRLWFKRTDKPTYGISSVRRFLNTWHQVSWSKPPGMKSSRFKLPVDDKFVIIKEFDKESALCMYDNKYNWVVIFITPTESKVRQTIVSCDDFDLDFEYQGDNYLEIFGVLLEYVKTTIPLSLKDMRKKYVELGFRVY